MKTIRDEYQASGGSGYGVRALAGHVWVTSSAQDNSGIVAVLSAPPAKAGTPCPAGAFNQTYPKLATRHALA
jgi:hypothetical protein